MSNRQKRAKDRGRANEYRLVKALEDMGVQASRVPLSGALPGLPGDVSCPELQTLFEAKVLAVQKSIDGARYIRIDVDWLDKIAQEAKRVGCDRGVVVLRGASLRKRMVLMDLSDYVTLVTKPSN